MAQCFYNCIANAFRKMYLHVYMSFVHAYLTHTHHMYGYFVFAECIFETNLDRASDQGIKKMLTLSVSANYGTIKAGGNLRGGEMKHLGKYQKLQFLSWPLALKASKSPEDPVLKTCRQPGSENDNKMLYNSLVQMILRLKVTHNQVHGHIEWQVATTRLILFTSADGSH